MLPVAEFKRRVVEIAGRGIVSRSALNIRNGGGVFERILCGGAHRRVLEIGTYRGVTAAYLALHCEHVVTVDLRLGRLERGGDTYGRQPLWDALGLQNIELVLVRSDAEKASALARIAFDLAFVDGDHSAAGVARDFELVKRCGAVLFHDYADGSPVKAFVDGLPRTQVEVMDMFAFWRAPLIVNSP